MKPYLNIDPGTPRPDDDPENPVAYEPPPITENDELDDDDEVGDPPKTGAAMRPVTEEDEARGPAEQQPG